MAPLLQQVFIGPIYICGCSGPCRASPVLTHATTCKRETMRSENQPCHTRIALRGDPTPRASPKQTVWHAPLRPFVDLASGILSCRKQTNKHSQAGESYFVLVQSSRRCTLEQYSQKPILRYRHTETSSGYYPVKLCDIPPAYPRGDKQRMRKPTNITSSAKYML